MSDKPIDPSEAKAQGETNYQLNQEQIEENAAKLLNLAKEGGRAACREFYVELKAKGYQPQQITEITFTAVQKLQQRIEELRSLNSTDENS